MFKIKFSKKAFSTIRGIIYDPQCDFYKVLNVEDNSELKSIKKSFFEISMKVHPDKGGDEEQFKRISKAYEVLKSTEDRQMYDKLKLEYVESIDQRTKKTNLGDKIHQTRNNRFYENWKTHNTSYRSDQYDHSYYNTKYDGKARQHSNYSYEHEDAFKYNEYYEFLKEYFKNPKQNKKEEIQFKINIKYIPPEKETYFQDFILSREHKHFYPNRIKAFEERRTKNKNSKMQINQFQIHNNMEEDTDYMYCLNKSEREDEKLDMRICVKDLKFLSPIAISVISLSFLYVLYSIN